MLTVYYYNNQLFILTFLPKIYLSLNKNSSIQNPNPTILPIKTPKNKFSIITLTVISKKIIVKKSMKYKNN